MPDSLWRRVLFPTHRPSTPDVPAVLVITGSTRDQAFYKSLRALDGWDVVITPSMREALGLVEHRQFPIVLCDRDLPGSDWREVLARIVERSPRTCFLLASRVSDEYLWREVVMCGGYDVVPKPLAEYAVTQTLQRAWYYWKADSAPAKPSA